MESKRRSTIQSIPKSKERTVVNSPPVKFKEIPNEHEEHMLLQQENDRMNKEDNFNSLLMTWDNSDLNFKPRKKVMKSRSLHRAV